MAFRVRAEFGLNSGRILAEGGEWGKARQIGILNGSGGGPGLKAATRAVVRRGPWDG